MRPVIYSLCICLSFMLHAQEKKMEKETKLKNNEVPILLKQMINEFMNEAKKVSYFMEETNNKKSYEVKFQFKKSFYSIEFDDSVKLEDIEVLINKNEMEPAAFEAVTNHLSTYEKFKIEKIQKQFSSENRTDEEVLRQALNEGVGDIIRYEIEASIKSDGEWKALELLFSSDGAFISEKEIIKRSSDFILY
ncbi:hypothetical protein [Ekhidna sp.]|uniref:hypothetical protein n=1 Tax=Ekhidna sp. TaxID=2608089 RepID=UPI003C7C9BD6